jgi:hypothetical protein
LIVVAALGQHRRKASSTSAPHIHVRSFADARQADAAKRPVILRSSPRRVDHQPDGSGILTWAGGFVLVAIILAGTIGHYLKERNNRGHLTKRKF